MNNFAFMLVLHSFRWPTKNTIQLNKKTQGLDWRNNGTAWIEQPILSKAQNPRYQGFHAIHNTETKKCATPQTNPKDFVLCCCFFLLYHSSL